MSRNASLQSYSHLMLKIHNSEEAKDSYVINIYSHSLVGIAQTSHHVCMIESCE
jgi:hypothetical protein